ncbi:zf-MYND domain-containing protein [Phanerochaete sordida]|uniref:Zf-MYND domain-containing protein n=1 Tax=Phanerochaete sordida TaxID=48140 RepID=A0A9P3G1E6_9APHY|nr:zf-MYND domain-containing protein [Phanerochaete sordida]
MAAPSMTVSHEILSGPPDPATLAQHKQAATLHNEGMALERQGKHADAIKLFKKALEIKLAAMGRTEGTAVTYNALAESQIQLGQLDDALENVQQALAIVNQQGSVNNQAYYRETLGLIYEMKGDLEKARSTRTGSPPDRYLCSYFQCPNPAPQPLGQLSQCSRCKAILYCSTPCRNNDWKRHKKYCRETKAEL